MRISSEDCSKQTAMRIGEGRANVRPTNSTSRFIIEIGHDEMCAMKVPRFFLSCHLSVYNVYMIKILVLREFSRRLISLARIYHVIVSVLHHAEHTVQD